MVAKKLQRSFEKTTKRALQRVLGKLSEAKESIERDLIEEEYMTETINVDAISRIINIFELGIIP